MADRELRVGHRADVFAVQRATRDIAREVGFKQVAAEELTIVASELASNILKYGVRGRIRLESIADPILGIGMRVTAFDQGPPFRDFELALRDGFDDDGPLDPAKILHRGGIGAGLGAVKRFSDELGWGPIEGGKQIWAHRYLIRTKAPRLLWPQM